VCSRNQTPDRRNQLIARRRGLGRSEIVDGIVGKDHPMDSGLINYIAFEAGLRTLACPGNKQAIPADPLVENTDVHCGIAQSLRQVVRPTPIHVRSRGIAIGNRSPQGCYRSKGSRILHVEIEQKIVAPGSFGACEAGIPAHISIRDIARLKSRSVVSRSWVRLGEIETDGNVGKTRDLELNRVAYGSSSGLHKDGR
jgi:hypothetical protein